MVTVLVRGIAFGLLRQRDEKTSLEPRVEIERLSWRSWHLGGQNASSTAITAKNAKIAKNGGNGSG